MTRFFSTILIFLFCETASAENHAATVTRVIGSAKILNNPIKEIKGTQPHALYEGMYYSEKAAVAGDKLEQGNIIQTGKGARARLIYDNGDQISVAPDSAYQVSWDAGKSGSKPMIDVLMGKIRSTIKKDGPRSGTQVRTKSMAMGIRGTDFFVVARGKSGESEVSVIRGTVDVKAKGSKEKSLEIPAGYSAKVGEVKPAQANEKKQPAGIVLQKTSKQKIIDMQESSVVSSDSPPPPAIAELEKKAITNTIEDIKVTEPRLYAELEKKGFAKIENIDLLQSESLKNLYKDAPVDENVKPGAGDLKNKSDKDIYEKYFKIED